MAGRGPIKNDILRAGPAFDRNETLIDLTVAVIIDVIAELVARRDFRYALGILTLDADHGLRLALAFLSPAYQLVAVKAVATLIDITVAVVIDVVVAKLLEIRIELPFGRIARMARDIVQRIVTAPGASAEKHEGDDTQGCQNAISGRYRRYPLWASVHVILLLPFVNELEAPLPLISSPFFSRFVKHRRW